MLAIETIELTKTYQGQGGCRDISLAVPRGSIFGLLGPNGAGKSTLVKMLMGLLQPTSGEAKLLGRPLHDFTVRQKVGFLPENFSYHDWLTGHDLLRFHASLFGLPAKKSVQRIPLVLEMVGLTQHARKRVGSYSKGMQQRIGLGCALLPDPELLFLDEPTSALDPIGRKVVRDLLVTLRGQGKTIFLNSHLLSELETICDQVAIIKEGCLIFQGDWRDITTGRRVKVVLAGTMPVHRITACCAGWQLISQQASQNLAGGQELIFASAEKLEVPELVTGLVQSGAAVHEVTPMIESLEKLFLEVVTDSQPKD
ncbi:ABC transporter ATP-binding protein [Desulfotomaculum sp. 1211_IL3151]|uniref:ABC transporter ATP-binding protein n=1 Tax=Desulfotomaculum sp. 1211_IL3151 TaxID=3084055 RepID=UPI002FDB142C